jgi:hypothetical protein
MEMEWINVQFEERDEEDDEWVSVMMQRYNRCAALLGLYGYSASAREAEAAEGSGLGHRTTKRGSVEE